METEPDSRPGGHLEGTAGHGWQRALSWAMLRAFADDEKPPGLDGGQREGTKAEEEEASEWATGFPVTGPGHHLQ